MLPRQTNSTRVVTRASGPHARVRPARTRSRSSGVSTPAGGASARPRDGSACRAPKRAAVRASRALERRRRPRRKLQQAAHAVGIDADMPPRAGKARSGRPLRRGIARPGHRRAAEVQRPPVARAQRLHAIRIEKFRQAIEWARLPLQCRSAGGVAQCLARLRRSPPPASWVHPPAD